MATMQRSGDARTDSGRWVKQGLIGGIVAGIVFAIFEMMVAYLLNAGEMGFGAFWMPLRMIGAIVLGQQALDPTYSLVTAAVVGIIAHMVFSMVFGAVFGAIASAVPVFRRSTGALLVSASIFGLLLWLVNFYLISPAFGWIWFPTRANQFWQGFVAHTFFYGTVLGFYLDRALAPRRQAVAR